MMMKEIAKSLQANTMQGEVKIRALSWREHVAAGHTPFRRVWFVKKQLPRTVIIDEKSFQPVLEF